MELVLLAIIMVVFTWILFGVYQYDQKVPTGSIKKHRRVLVIFPHPDDESLSCGGTIREFSRQGAHITLVVFTKGERGVEGALLTPKLKPIRTKEMEQSARSLGIKNLIQYDLGDGELDNKKDILYDSVNEILKKNNPDLVITYDLSGLYGHPDHIAVSEVVTNLIISQYKYITLWYISRSERMYKQMKLPVHMAKDKNFIRKRQLPTFKVNLSLYGIKAKVSSLMSHTSQHFAFKKSRPKFLPLWFIVSTQVTEYFYLAHQGK